MSFQPSSGRRTRLGLACTAVLLAGLAGGASAQVRSVQQAAQPAAPAAAAANGLPRAAGLPSPITAPGGFGSVAVPSSANTAGAAGFGIGATTGTVSSAGTVVPATGAMAGVTPVLPGGVVVNNAGLPSTDGTASNTAVMGAGAGGGTSPSQYIPSGNGGFSAIDIARSFFLADVNHDGDLTPAEAARLPIRTMGFDQMDRNNDGRVTRSEYEDSLR